MPLCEIILCGREAVWRWSLPTRITYRCPIHRNADLWKHDGSGEWGACVYIGDGIEAKTIVWVWDSVPIPEISKEGENEHRRKPTTRHLPLTRSD